MPAACGLPLLPGLPEPGAVDRPAGSAVSYDELGHDGTDCFQRHLREAIQLNEDRAPIYSAWSDGASEPISRDLIRAERRALAVAWWIDRRARRFQDAGVPIVCADFVSMSLTPPLEAARPDPPSRAARAGPDPESLEAALVDAYGVGGFPAVAAAADSALDRIADSPEYHCMVRHLVESIERVARLAPRHAAAAEARGLPTTIPLSELLLRLHLYSLEDGTALDRDAAPLQQVGIPIICRDVPPIREAPPGRDER